MEKYFIILFFISLLMSFNSYSFSNQDSLLTKEKYKLSRKEFVKHYGQNDTLNAIIDLFFDKRRNAFISRAFIIAFSLASAGGIITQHPLGFIILADLLFIPAAVFSIIRAPILLHKYSRKNLYKLIDTYPDNIPDKYFLKIKKRLR